jgi:Ca2+-binding EF-hand superfamily protein
MAGSGDRRWQVGLGLTLALGLTACAGMPGMMGGKIPPAMAEMMQSALADRAKLKAFDTDANSEITKEELERGLEQQFAAYDANKDGVLKAQEVSAANDKIKLDDAAMPPLRDWNQSSAVEFDEFAAWNRGKFRRTDSDSDGVITTAELTAPPRIRPQGGPPGGMPPGGMPPGGKPPGGGGMPGGGGGGGFPGGR